MENTISQELYQVENDQDHLVVRNEIHSEQNATISFGPDFHNQKYTKTLDVINYYKPNPKNQLYLPENSFFNSNGKIKAHMGGETTYRADSSNQNKNISTHTNNYIFENQFEESYQIDSDNDTVVPEVRSRGLFEVPFDICSMPRLIAPFKGFSKIITSRAIKLLTFNETEDNELICKLDKCGLRTLQKQVGDLNIVSVSFTGDPKSGKSFLASLLVGKENVSFNISESYINPNNILRHGTIWMYIAVYLEKYAYVFLDFEGFEHSEKSKTKMLLFAFAISSLVFCNIKYSLMNGIHNSITAMIQLTKKPIINTPLNEDEILDEENEFLEILKNKGTRLMSNTYDTDNFNELNQELDSEIENKIEQKELWNPPIIQFIFRDCSGFVKCIDDRIFTPETLVEQGLFENYLDLFTIVEKDLNFKNEMLDSFEIFTNRKYISLPHPTLSTHPYNDNDYSEKDGLNLTEFFVKLLSSDKNDFRKLTKLGYDDFNLNSNLSSLFYEKLDHLKSILYHDTLNYSIAHSQLNGRMFGEYLKKLSNEFNKNNNLSIKKLNELLSNVFLGENSNILKESLLQFLRQIRSKVAPKLPLDSKTLLNLVYSAKFSSTNFFESKAFGTPDEYKYQLDELSDTLDELIKKLQDKNKILMTTQIANYVERKEANIRANIIRSGYEINDLNNDLSKLKKSLNTKFTEDDLVMKILTRASQNLIRLFNDIHPETFIHNLNYSKSTSIEETFENLNSEINSMTSNLYLNSQLKNQSAYPGEDNMIYRNKKNKKKKEDNYDKLNSDLEDNILDFEEEEQDEDEDETEEQENQDKDEIDEDVEEVISKLNTLEVQKELNDNLEDMEEDDEDIDDALEQENKQDNIDENTQLNKYKGKKDNKYKQKTLEKGSQQWIFGESGGTMSFREDTTKYRNQNSNVVYDIGGTTETKEDEMAQILDDDFVQDELDGNNNNNKTKEEDNDKDKEENNKENNEDMEEDADVSEETLEETSVNNETEEETPELVTGDNEEQEETFSTTSADDSMETNENEDETVEESTEEYSETSAESTEEIYDEVDGNNTEETEQQDNDNKDKEDKENEQDEDEDIEFTENLQVKELVNNENEDKEDMEKEDELKEQENNDKEEEVKEDNKQEEIEQNNNDNKDQQEIDNQNQQNVRYSRFKKKEKRFIKSKHLHRGAVLKEIFDKAADSLRLHKSSKNT